jgi:hypothetical protein
MIYASVEDGTLTLSNHDDTKRTFSLDEEGKAALAATLKEWDGIESVMCSSSVDFAEEYGVPEDVSVRDFIGKAQIIAYGPPRTCFTCEEMEEMLRRLEEGDSASVIGLLKNQISGVKRQYEEALAE